MNHRVRNTALALLGTTALFCVQAAAADATENIGVPIITTPSQGSGYTDVAETDFGEAGLTAMYVDSSGAAHIAYTKARTNSSNNGEINLCTIPAGGSSCGSASTLQTDGTVYDSGIQSLKYLPDGNGSAVLAVGLIDNGNTTGQHPPFSSTETAPWTETEVFQPGSSTGTAIGATYDSGGQSAGDEIYVPDQDGIDIVGLWGDYDWPSVGSGPEADDYQFESFTNPSGDPAPQYLGVEAAQSGGSVSTGEALPGQWPAGVTELANGAVGVLSYDITHSPNETNPGLSPVGMYVQPASGGAFSAIHDLGISGPIETQFAPGAETYLVNGVSSDPSGGNVPENLELYQFQGTSLQALGTLGATDDNIDGNPFNEESEWDSMPPIYEDDAGNLYAAWYANPGDDACPGSSQNGSTVVSGCVMYREVGAGGVMGPKVVLSEDYGDGQSDGIGDVDQIAANSSGVGWVLDWRYPGSSSNLGLYAEPLSAAASVPTSPTVTGTVTSVPVTCVGTGSCSLTVSLDSGASAIRASAARGHARRSGALVLSRSFTVKAGRRVRLRLALGARDARLLSRARAMRARLVVTESLGMTAVKKQIYSAALTLQR